ncbi:MAG TPA: ABC transporter ATP-binding protein [Oscillospiraceae bacterium]|nr:ABC transporter ATP-binding protein [Oscillospiraceae bacterium]HPF55871.1 ABC transporter ATP-binding protein [Clostridiales bacterium]HPK36443.1 ABC transporter ATP-binding protein [Oscillospiraceae bacterium]HPR76372.1 ABC transporter ATP-binding protein [Oscillospiraceae bacterium]
MKRDNTYPVGKTISRLLRHLGAVDKSLWGYFIMYTIFAGIYPLFSVVLPKLLIGELISENPVIIHIIYIAAGFLAAASLFGFLKNVVYGITYPRMTMVRIDYLRDMAVKLMTMDYKYCEDASFAEENGRAFESTNSNMNGIEGVYHKLFETPAIFLTSLAFIIFIGMLDFWILLALVANIGTVYLIGRLSHFYQYGKRSELKHGERRVRYYDTTTHDFSYGKDIRLYNFRDRISKNFETEIRGYTDVWRSIKNREYALGFLGLLTLLISDVATYGLLIVKMRAGMSIADFSMYLAAMVSLSILLKTLIENVTFVINEGQYAHDFFVFMDKDFGEKGGDLPAVKNDTLEIEFKDVSFKYPKTDRYIFQHLNLKIEKGERLAIVGINGAGKSTLVKLLLGLFQVTEGEILINGQPLNAYNRLALWSMFSVVFQEINILAFTVKENIACRSDEIDEDRVRAAIDKVGLTEKIGSFEKGPDQMMLKIIDENGALLSGGESQKLAIARALYKNANMVIMDEPTAALDALAEAEIYQDFSHLIKGKTAIYISHRLASTKFCDKIALFDNDGLSEYGNHTELMRKRGNYYKMFTVQGKYYREGGAENG